MARPIDIAPATWERAELLMDQFRNVTDDRELIARCLMANTAAMQIGLTPKQASVLHFVRGFVAEHGYSPTLSEIAGGTAIRTRSNVHSVVQALVAKGLVAHSHNRTRSILPCGMEAQ